MSARGLRPTVHGSWLIRLSCYWRSNFVQYKCCCVTNWSNVKHWDCTMFHLFFTGPWQFAIKSRMITNWKYISYRERDFFVKRIKQLQSRDPFRPSSKKLLNSLAYCEGAHFLWVCLSFRNIKITIKSDSHAHSLNSVAFDAESCVPNILLITACLTRLLCSQAWLGFRKDWQLEKGTHPNK